MNLTTKLLIGIGVDQPTTFRDLERILGPDAPGKDERAGWRQVFEQIDALEQCALVTVSRRSGYRFGSVQLTALGAERAREAREYLKKENSLANPTD